MNYFTNDDPSFVSVSADSFVIEHDEIGILQVMIQKIQPVRKRFEDGKLACHSMDGRVSKQGKYCIFCEDKYRCQKKLRLSMIDLSSHTLRPIILDINQASFENLEFFVQGVGEDQIHCTSVSLKIVYDDNDRRCVAFME